MSKKFIPVLLALILGGLFLAYGVMGGSEKNPDDPKSKYERILRNVGIVLEQGHYNPKPINDAFSAEVLKTYEKMLDPDKITFLLGDIQKFSQFSDNIDDEIHGAPLESFYVIRDTYLKRINELDSLYQLVLNTSFDFTIPETLQTDRDKRTYPANAKERHEYARKRMKYQVLIRYADLLELNDSATTDKKSKEELKKEAIEKTSKQMNRYFETMRNHNTSDELFTLFVNAITGNMDPHTTYMAPIDKRTFDEMLSGTFFGIGAQLRESEGQIKIVSLITGMPAWKSGEIQPDDVILKVGQGDQPPVDVTGFALEDAVKMIRGKEKGSVVKLTLKKSDGSVKVVSLKRDEISLEATFAKSAVLEGENKIGYIRLPEFYADFRDPQGRRSSRDMEIEVKKLMAAHIDGLIIDLRGNGGGSLEDVVDIVGLFIKDGPVVQVKSRGQSPVILNSRSDEPLYRGPLTVLVDEFSASASEIFAAAIQDYHRGIVIGSSSTFGKGTVQRNISLDPVAENSLFSRPAEGLGNVKLTFRKFYRIDGGATQLKGVVPDIIIPDRFENSDLREKDNPDALKWDTIEKAGYSIWNPGYNFHKIVRNAALEIKQNESFDGIQNVVDQLDQIRKQEAPLQLAAFKQMQEKIMELSLKLEKFNKADDPLNVEMLDVDDVRPTNDSIAIKTQEMFVNGIANDIYVAETVQILNEVIGVEQIVRNKEKKTPTAEARREVILE